MAGAQETLANWTGECKPGTQARGLHGKQRCPQCGLHDTGSWDSKGAGGTPLPSCRWADSRRPAERPMGWRGQAPGRRTGGMQLSSKSRRAPACKTQASQADRPRGPALPAGTSSRSAHVLSLSPGGNETSTSTPVGAPQMAATAGHHGYCYGSPTTPHEAQLPGLPPVLPAPPPGCLQDTARILRGGLEASPAAPAPPTKSSNGSSSLRICQFPIVSHEPQEGGCYPPLSC